VTTPFGAESAPAAAPEPQTSEPTPQGAQPAESAPQAPQGADPRVFEQMQSQLSQFNDVAGQMAEYLPAIQQIAQQQGGQQPNEPTVEDLAAQFFGEPAYGDYQDPGLPDGARFDPYTGQPIQQPPSSSRASTPTRASRSRSRRPSSRRCRAIPTSLSA
jgi:hypothetical protein